MKPICTACQRFFKPSKNGVFFLEGMPKSNDAPKGTSQPGAWTPYKLWSGDEWTCQGCDTTIIVGVGAQPIGEHFEEDFADKLVSYKPYLQINDC